MKRLSLSIILCVLFSTSALGFFNQEIVEIHPQPDSPLQLSNPVSKWRVSKKPNGEEIDMLTVNFVVRNLTNKTVRAYAIRHFDGDSKTGSGGSTFGFTLKPDGIFQPNQSQTESMGEFGSVPKPKSVKLAVDFVEFTDGSTWGQDLTSSAQRFAGVRAGVRAGQEYLLKISREKGIEAVIKAVDEVDVSPPNDQNDIWKRGFKTGVRTLIRQIKAVYEKVGIKAVPAELQKQFFSQIDN